MNPAIIGIIGIALLVILFVLRMPVGFAMAMVGFIGFSYLVSPGAGLGVLARDMFYTFSSYSLTVIPMFVFMGCIASGAGMSKRLYDAGYLTLGRLRGGLAMATIAGCAGFAAICGSTNACAAAMGKVALPEMKRYHYDDSLATGTVSAAGSLGILIPPSTIFIVYGIMTEQSIGKLFIAGVFPGLILAGLFITAVYLICWRNPSLAPAATATSWKEKLDGIMGVGEMLVLFILVISGLFLGWFSPTQAGGAGAAGALLISLIRRQLTWQNFLDAVKDTLRITCMIMVIVAGATVFGHFMAVSKIPLFLADWVSALPLPPMAAMAVIVFLCLIGGSFMDSLAMIMLTVPIFYPAVVALGFNPIWFGVIIVLVVEMGVITPPVGINVYVVKGIAKGVPLETVFKGVWPFLLAELVMVGILMLFPQIATFLPSLTKY